MIASFRLSEYERGRRPRSRTNKSGSSRTSQQKAARGELHFIRFLGSQLAAPPPTLLLSDFIDEEWIVIHS